MQLAAVDPYTAVIQSKNENSEHLIMNFDVFSPSPVWEKKKKKLRPEIEKLHVWLTVCLRCFEVNRVN